MSEPEKKRKRGNGRDEAVVAEEGGGVVGRASRDDSSMMAEARSVRMTHSSPGIPDGHWLERGLCDESVERMAGFVRRMKTDTVRMRSGERIKRIGVGWNDERQNVVLHDEALLPHWREFADALRLSDFSGHFSAFNIQLPPAVRDLLTPALLTKRIASLTFRNIDFADASGGIRFAIALVKHNHRLEKFKWVNNPIVGVDQANDALEVLIGHPTLTKICLENSLRSNDVNGYKFLCSLLASHKSFLKIDLESNDIVTEGKTDIPDFLAANPPLRTLCLADNKLDDVDAALIADALKRNGNLQIMKLGGNLITRVGEDALRDAVFDPTSANAMADCNHTCWICDLLFDDENENSNANLNRGRKLYSLLSAKYREGSILRDLDLEFGDDAVKSFPRVLERICLYSGCFEPPWQRPAQPLTIAYEILRGWKMPELLEGHTRR